MSEQERYLEWNDKLRTQLAEKTQQNLDLNRKLTQQDKLIKTLHALFVSQAELHQKVADAAQMYEHYERTK